MTAETPDVILARNVLPGMVVRVTIPGGNAVDTLQVGHVRYWLDKNQVRLYSMTGAHRVLVPADQQVAVIA